MIGFKCMNRTCRKFLTKVEHFKWKDSSRMTKIGVCEDCWKKARKLKA